MFPERNRFARFSPCNKTSSLHMNADAPNCFNFIFTESDIQTVTPKTNISPSQKYRHKPRAAAAAVTMETDSESELIYRHKYQVLTSSQMV